MTEPKKEKCEACYGSGYINFLTDDGHISMRTCRRCDGYGYIKVEQMTNEEWFCQLPTEQKARWLYDHYVNARADEYYGRQEKTLSEYQKWLVSIHRGIDGTKID